MALSEDGIAAINHELNGTKWPSDARQSVIDLFERIAELEAEVGRLRARVAELEALLRRVEWQGRSEWDYDYAFCPECQSPENDGHAPDCELAAALREAGYFGREHHGLTDDQVRYWLPIPAVPEEATDGDRP